MKKHALAVSIALVAVVFLSACGGDPKVESAKGDTTAKSVDNDEPKAASKNVKEYFEAVVSGDPDQLGDAMKLVVPGSVAEAYLKYQRAGVDASIDNGSPDEATELETVDDGFKDCSNPDDPSDCVTWADFEATAGKLANFTVNNVPLNKRITVGDGSKVSAGQLGTVEFLVAYQSVQSGDLFVIVKVASKGAPVAINSGNAAYRGVDKRQSQNSSYYGVEELEADSTGTLGLIFTKAKVGGTLTLTLNSEDYMQTSKAKIKTQ
ncbi:hypothetical protein [Aeromicrobium sp. 9AM]|uniref:hypothetical protein n=1 Tax=Aeromicrobium sp. 9AM TaxID=2653126 RepID=UPI0012F3144C|nr:hypothetical protein [Aeromicrobium sp. 9AM]VXB05880.1 exported hypothetical protein [Aeromicrobium sp. 9AM]